MNRALLAIFVACVCLAVGEAGKCNSQSDCGADECCIQVTRSLSPICRKLKQKGDHCLTEETKNEDVFVFACPCAPGLKCAPEKTTDDNGIVTFLNDRCVPE
ncbi:toxin CSTX-20 [Trichonephila clavata]|uniref:Toxin CSTX-20 n=1 Tax=Trichonephila clavata TaxID=2740835 RepID=A0A8X6KSF2_TRICU|nr:toxin CSTX-20 [Trichonephila clavata]